MWQNELFFCLLYTFFDPFLLLYIPINGGGGGYREEITQIHTSPRHKTSKLSEQLERL